MARPSLGKSGRTVSASTKITQKEQEQLLEEYGSLYKAVRRGVELALGEATATTMDGQTRHGLDGLQEEPANPERGPGLSGVIVDEPEAFRNKVEGAWTDDPPESVNGFHEDETTTAAVELENTPHPTTDEQLVKGPDGPSRINTQWENETEERRQEAINRLKALSEDDLDNNEEDNMSTEQTPEETITGVVQPPEEDSPTEDNTDSEPEPEPVEESVAASSTEWEEDFTSNSPTTQEVQRPTFTPPPHHHVKDHIVRRVMVKGQMKKIWACACGEVMS